MLYIRSYMPPPAVVFSSLLKLSLDNPYLSTLFVADAHMKKEKNLKILTYSFSEHFENRPCMRVLKRERQIEFCSPRLSNLVLFLDSFVSIIQVQTWNAAGWPATLWHSRSCYSALPWQQALNRQDLTVNRSKVDIVSVQNMYVFQR